MKKFSERELAFMNQESVGRMAQMGTDAMPHVTPLCYACTERAIYIDTSSNSWKIRNLITAPEVAFVVDEYFEDWDKLKGIRMLGKAEVLADGDDYEIGKVLLFQKYPEQMKNKGWVDGNEVVIKINLTTITSWGL